MIEGQGEMELNKFGAERESNNGRGRFDLLPYEAIENLAKWYEDGSKKYSPRNWEKGLSVQDCINRMIRHSLKAANGWVDEDHLAAVMWNAAAAITMLRRYPDQNDHFKGTYEKFYNPSYNETQEEEDYYKLGAMIIDIAKNRLKLLGDKECIVYDDFGPYLDDELGMAYRKKRSREYYLEEERYKMILLHCKEDCNKFAKVCHASVVYLRDLLDVDLNIDGDGNITNDPESPEIGTLLELIAYGKNDDLDKYIKSSRK